MVSLVVACVIVVAGVAVAAVIRRRDAGQLARGKRWSVPAQLERGDFDDPTADHLVVVFSSVTCDACETTWQRAQEFERPGMVLQAVSYQDHPELHDRYGIDAVPTLVVADREGVVQRSFVGPPSVAELTDVLSVIGD